MPKNSEDNRIQELEQLVESQQRALEIYRKRFNKVKRSVKNPLFAASFFFSYVKRKLWRFFPTSVSPKEYTSWIESAEEKAFEGVSRDELCGFSPENLGITLIDIGAGRTTENIIKDIQSINTPFFATFDHADTLRPHAMFAIGQAIAEDPEFAIIYGDEDELTLNGLRTNPVFKPDYSPDTIVSYNYIGDFCVYNKKLFDGVDISENAPSKDLLLYDLILRAFESGDKIYHIPMILHSSHPDKTSSLSHRFEESEKEKRKKDQSLIIDHKQNALKRRGIKAKSEWMERACDARVVYGTQPEPLVSVIIPSKDHPDLLKKCLDSFKEKTDYKNYEIIVVDNGSNPENRKKYEAIVHSAHHSENSANNDIQPIYHYVPMDFNFAKMCNIGAGLASGEYLFFLNDDIEIVNASFLRRMLGAAMQPHSGAVGAKLIYPSSHIIQHDGIIDIINGPVHALHFGDDRRILANGRNLYDFNCLGVTGAALLISKNKFDGVGGFCEELTIGYNDVDLCYTLHESGYFNIIRNDAVLIHHESISRGLDAKDEKKHSRLMKEQRLLYLRHPSLMSNDPFYNPNLTDTNTDYSINIEEF